MLLYMTNSKNWTLNPLILSPSSIHMLLYKYLNSAYLMYRITHCLCAISLLLLAKILKLALWNLMKRFTHWIFCHIFAWYLLHLQDWADVLRRSTDQLDTAYTGWLRTVPPGHCMFPWDSSSSPRTSPQDSSNPRDRSHSGQRWHSSNQQGTGNTAQHECGSPGQERKL